MCLFIRHNLCASRNVSVCFVRNMSVCAYSYAVTCMYLYDTKSVKFAYTNSHIFNNDHMYMCIYVYIDIYNKNGCEDTSTNMTSGIHMYVSERVIYIS